MPYIAEESNVCEDVQKLKWLHPYLGELMLDGISLDTISLIKAEKRKQSSKARNKSLLGGSPFCSYRARDDLEWIEK